MKVNFRLLRFLSARLLLLFFAFHLTLNSGLIVFEDKDTFIKICKKRYVLVMDIPQLNTFPGDFEIPAEKQSAFECSPSLTVFIMTSSDVDVPVFSVTPELFGRYHSKDPGSLLHRVEVPPPRS